MSRHSVAQRLGFAFPDAVTAATFALLWVAPLALGEGGVRGAMLLMMVEFVLINATGFMALLAFAPDRSRRERLKVIVGFALFYLAFITAFSLIFDAWWPFLAFGWLLYSKVAVILERGAPDIGKRSRMQLAWGLSVVAYVGGVLLTSLLPMPRLGLSASVLPQLAIPGSGLWVEQPQRVLGFGLLYFGLLAWTKWKDWESAVVAPKRRARQ